MEDAAARARRNQARIPVQQGVLLSMNPQLGPHGGAPGQVYSRQSTGQPSTASASGARGGSQSFGYSYDQGYGGHQVNPSYGAAQDYGSEQTSQRVHPYAQQGQNPMYSMPGAQASVQGSAQYDSVQQYQGRETPLDVLSGGYTPVAQGQYYNVSGQEAPTSAPVGGMPAHPSSQYASLGYTPTPPPGAVGRESVTPSYAASMTDPHQAGSRGPYPDSGFTEQSSHNWEQYYGQFQDAVKQIFTSVKNGQLSEAGRHLMSLTDWIFQVAEPIGLHRDDAEQHQQKLKLWEDFNNCWLSTLQKQKEIMEDLKKTGQSLGSSLLISHEYLKRMGDHIVKCSNAFEKHGLVDYQMGIWEEEIIAMVIKCQSILEDNGHAGDASQRVEAQSSRK